MDRRSEFTSVVFVVEMRMHGGLAFYWHCESAARG